MKLTKEAITETSRVKRLNLINAVTGVKPANLVGTKSKSGNTNVAIFSSVVHLGSHPALLGFFMRPQHEVRRDTYHNIVETSSYTINQVHTDFVANAHYTSAKFEQLESEFEKCHLDEEYIDGFYAPFVKQSRIKLAMKLQDVIPLSINKCSLLIGSIEYLDIADEFVDKNGEVDLELLNAAGIGGLNRYYELKEIANFPYARVTDLPNFDT